MYVNIKKLTKAEIVNDFSASDVGGSSLSEEEFKYIFSALGVWFDYDHAKNLGVVNAPHAVLFNGTHTDFYFYPETLFHNSQITEILAVQLAKKLAVTKKLMDISKRERYKLLNRHYIIGPNESSFLIGAMSKLCNCWQGVTYKVGAGDQEWRTFPLPKYSTVQLINNYIVTADILDAVHAAILEPLDYAQTYIHVQNEVGTIVNTTGMQKLGCDWKIISLISKKQQFWPENICPLCKAGSKALSIEHNWEELAAACWREPTDD